MRWQIFDFIFDEDTKVLSTNKNTQLLEPKTAALLSFFCRNKNKNITRDELMSNVWQGQIVADNTINRVIVLLRKAFNDDEKIKRFIVTVPKVGYRFIAPVLEKANDDSVAHELPKKPNHLMLISLIAMMAIAIYFALNFKKEIPEPSNTTNPDITPLTRQAGIQHQADVSNDGKWLVMSRYIENNDDVLILMDIDKQNPVQISQKGGSANYAKWAHDDSFIIYLYTNQNSCEFHKIDFNNNKPQTAYTIYQCPQNNFSEFTLSVDNSKLYFIERETPFAPYFAYELDLASKSKRKLSQPMATGIGNHYLDINPKTNELLMISNQKPGMSSIYILDIINNTYEQKLRLGYHINTAIWSHENNKIVHPAPHPSYQLMQTNIETTESITTVSDSRRISKPKRIGTKDYFFTSYLYNRDIEMSGVESSELNSNVMDYLPALSRNANKLAFISKRSGYSKIWIKDLNTNTLTSIEPPDKARIFFKLDWSFDDTKILANTNNGIVIYDVKSKYVVKMISPNLPVYAASWIDNDLITFSLYAKQKWIMYNYNLAKNKKQPVTNQWAMMIANPQQTIYFDQDLIAYHSDIKLPANDQCNYTTSRYRLTYHLDGNDLYCQSKDNKSLLKWPNIGKPPQLIQQLNAGEFYTVAKGKTAISLLKNTSSDIMRTNF